jgi:cytochrome b6-f complex iron-sulfur subunit
MKSEKQPPIHNTAKKPSRRSFLTLIWGGLGFVALGELLWVGVSFFKPLKSQTEHTSRAVIEVGAVEDFAPGSVTPNRNGGFYLSRLENGGFLAMSSRCTHLGCAITCNQSAGQFECPCHASAFNIRGEVLRPPAPHPLDYFPVVVKNGRVAVHIHEKKKRSRFSYNQVTSL